MRRWNKRWNEQCVRWDDGLSMKSGRENEEERRILRFWSDCRIGQVANHGTELFDAVCARLGLANTTRPSKIIISGWSTYYYYSPCCCCCWIQYRTAHLRCTRVSLLMAPGYLDLSLHADHRHCVIIVFPFWRGNLIQVSSTISRPLYHVSVVLLLS